MLDQALDFAAVTLSPLHGSAMHFASALVHSLRKRLWLRGALRLEPIAGLKIGVNLLQCSEHKNPEKLAKG